MDIFVISISQVWKLYMGYFRVENLISACTQTASHCFLSNS